MTGAIGHRPAVSAAPAGTLVDDLPVDSRPRLFADRGASLTPEGGPTDGFVVEWELPAIAPPGRNARAEPVDDRASEV